jgi:AAA ATPase domain
MAKGLKKAALSQKKRESDPRSRVPSLHGRETEIALIDGLLDHIDQGGSTLVFSGAPGIGKSALLEEAKSRARERGIIVLGMTGVPAEVHLAFAGLERALRPLVKQAKSLAPHQRSALLNAFRISDEASVSPDLWLVALATLTLLTEGAGHCSLLTTPSGWTRRPVRCYLLFPGD